MIKLTLPATSANLAAGFDCMALALSLYNQFEITINQSNHYQIINAGYIEKGLENPQKNLFIQAYEQICKQYKFEQPYITLRTHNMIPMQSGIGSSATAILGGIITAYALNQQELNYERILQDALQLERHTDNLSACLYGGLTISTMIGSRPYVYHTKINAPILALIISPALKTSTEKSRQYLFPQVKLEDAVYNVSRASILSAALIQGNLSFLKEAMHDQLHEKYRVPKKIKYFSLKEQLLQQDHVLGVAMSGSGPSILILYQEATVTNFLKNLIKKHFDQIQLPFEIFQTEIDNTGAQIEI